MIVSEAFSATYDEARAKFHRACADGGGDIESRRHPRAEGPNGAPLFMDACLIGPENASNLLVLTSAVHGVEGFCGSGVQTALVSEGDLAAAGEGVAVLLIHAVNPYGFAHLHRTNEHNVDLNRNFIDFQGGRPSSEAYGAIHDHLCPEAWSGEIREAAERELRAYAAEHGDRAYQAAVSSGQYSHPNGLFYGGSQPSWSNRTFRALISDYGAAARRVLHLDFHTGLGPYGYGEPIGPDEPEELARAQAIWGDEVTSPAAGSSSSMVLSGTIDAGLKSAAPPHAQVTSVTLEFGVKSLDDTLDALRADNWLRFHGDQEAGYSHSIKADIRDAFYGDADDWKEAILTRSREMVAKALAALA